MKVLFVLCLALTGFALGCDKPAPEAPAAEEPAEPTTAEPSAAEPPAAEPPAEVATVDVTAAGTKLDPPVKPEQLPAGAWYCDMGTVHWAAMEKPADGNCPLCGMKLKQKAPAAAAEPEAGGGAAGAQPHAH